MKDSYWTLIEIQKGPSVSYTGTRDIIQQAVTAWLSIQLNTSYK